MKKLEGNKLVALLISAGMVTTLFAACTINTDQLGQGINDLGNAFITESETQKETDAPETKETETEITDETEETTEAAPTATPTATPSPTPLPQRVDFSDYTDNILPANFIVETEDFGESAHSDDDEYVFATFTGTRLVVTEAPNETVMNAINLIVDGFYQEAEGAYQRVVAKATAEYELKGVVEEPYAVNVDFEFTTNGHALSILMTYSVSGGDEDVMSIDFVCFDMLTGQYVTLPAVTNDPEGLESALRSDLEKALKNTPVVFDDENEEEEEEEDEGRTTTGTRETTEATTTETTAEIVVPKAKEYEVIYVAPTYVENDDGSYVMVYGIVDGEIYSAIVSIDDYADFFNRYGASIFFYG